MNQLIVELLEKLRPALKSVRNAEKILTEYWADRIALVWTTQDVHRAANEVKTVITEQQARQILAGLHHNYSAQYGLKWETLTDHIQHSGLGRDISKRELHRFIHRDLLAIDPPRKDSDGLKPFRR